MPVVSEIDDVLSRLHLVSVAAGGSDGGRALARAVEEGELIRLRRGAYWSRENEIEHSAASRARQARQRYLGQALSVIMTRARPAVLSSFSAAALWQLPVTTRWPSDVDLLVEPRCGIKAGNGIHVHRDAFTSDDVTSVGGFLVTTPARTLFDLARGGAMEPAVAGLDFALNQRRARPEQRVRKNEILELIDDAASSRGLAIARAVVEFADGLSGSPGESRSRVEINRAGFPRPALQVRHPSAIKDYYDTDFEWPEFRRIGEFDGRGKYLKENLPPGLDPGQAVYDEKLREDELRSEGNDFSRWGWRELGTGALRNLLVAGGLPLVRRPSAGLRPW
jgi:hypothetical protein